MADIAKANNRSALTPTDNTQLPDHKGILVMNAGDVAYRLNSGDSPVTVTLPAMSYIPFNVYSVDATGTTATSLILCN